MRNKIQYLNITLTNELNNALTIITAKMIEAFVKVYGEAHRDYIAYAISNIHYYYFIPRQYMIYFKNTKLRSRDRYIINKYLGFINKIEISQSKDPEESLINLVENYLVKIDSPRLFTEEELNLIVNETVPYYTPDEENGKNIFLPIFILDLKTIFHEVNHALNIDALAVTEEQVISPTLFKTVIAEEFVNDYIASLALKEYRMLQGPVPKILKKFNIYNDYAINDYIVEYFFDTLSPLILESLITKNHRLLWGLAGKENIDKFSLLVKKLYKKGYNDKDYDALINLVDTMYKEVLNHDLPIDYKTFYQELEKNGCRIRRLKI